MEGYIRGYDTSKALATKCSMFKMENIIIEENDWIEDTNNTFTDYPYMAEIQCIGLTSDHFGEVVFDETLKSSCGHTAQTSQDKLIIYSSAPVTGTILAFVAWSNYTVSPEGNTTVNVVNGLDVSTVGMALDATQGKILNDKIKSSNLIYSDNVITVADWVSDSTYSAYPYRATVPCSGVDSTYFPDVCFSLTDALSGNFAPVCESIVDGVYIYASSIPTTDITIPSIKCTKMAE